MLSFPESVVSLAAKLSKLDGVGKRNAVRMAFRFIEMNESDIDELVAAITAARSQVFHCPVCGAYTESSPCAICANEDRDSKVICVVEDPRDVFAMEKAQSFNGKYHVLGGVLSPIDKVGPDDINLASLLTRVQNNGVREVLVATNSDVEGEATAAWIAAKLKPMKVRVTRLANGLPVGGNLEYADTLTLALAMEGRREL